MITLLKRLSVLVYKSEVGVVLVDLWLIPVKLLVCLLAVRVADCRVGVDDLGSVRLELLISLDLKPLILLESPLCDGVEKRLFLPPFFWPVISQLLSP